MEYDIVRYFQNCRANAVECVDCTERVCSLGCAHSTQKKKNYFLHHVRLTGNRLDCRKCKAHSISTAVSSSRSTHFLTLFRSVFPFQPPQLMHCCSLATCISHFFPAIPYILFDFFASTPTESAKSEAPLQPPTKARIKTRRRPNKLPSNRVNNVTAFVCDPRAKENNRIEKRTEKAELFICLTMK